MVSAVERALTEFWHNPSSVHRAGQAARQQVELARQDVARLVGVKARELTFTSGGTESLDLAIRGILGAFRSRAGAEPPLIITSKVEHAAVRDLVESLEKSGHVRVRWLELCTEPGRRGVIDTARLAEQITPDAVLVCVQWANNETGAIQPVQAVSDACRAVGVPLVVDAVQWVGKMPARVGAGASPSEPPASAAARTGEDARLTSTPDVRTRAEARGSDGADIVCDALIFSPHKFHGVKGVGVLWTRPGLRMRPVLHGSQELGRRGGTENVPGILGAGGAAREAIDWLADAAPRDAVRALRDLFERTVLAALPDASVNGPTDRASRLWNTTNIAFPRLEAEALLLLLSERGVCASAGAACSSGSLEPSPVLLAMGVPEVEAHGSLRFSLSRFSTRDDVDAAALAVIACVQTLKRSMPGA